MLNTGFLGEQNVRNTYPGSPEDQPYTRRAAQLITSGDFTGALAVLRAYRFNATLTDMMLSGQAHVGLGDYAAARKDFGTAIKKRKNFTAGQVALGEMEARYGDKAEAAGLLATLATRRDACAGKCSDAGALAAGIVSIEAALRDRK